MSNARWWFATLAAAFLLVGCGPRLTGSASGNSDVTDELRRIACREPVWNFGVIDNVATPQLKHEFLIRNLTDSPLQCEAAASCGCIVAEKKLTIGPHATYALPIEVRLAGVPGSFSKTVSVHVPSKPASTLTLGIEGTISPNGSLRSSSPTMNFGSISRPTTRSIQIARYNATPVKYREASSHQSLRVVGWKAQDKLDSLVELTVELDPTHLPLKPFTAELKVVTDHPQFGTLSIPIHATVVHGIPGLVESLFVPRLQSHEVAQKALLVKDASNPGITAIAYTGDDAVSVELTDDENHLPMLQIRRNPGTSLQSRVANGIVELQFGGHRNPIQLPLRVVLSAG